MQELPKCSIAERRIEIAEQLRVAEPLGRGPFTGERYQPGDHGITVAVQRGLLVRHEPATLPPIAEDTFDDFLLSLDGQ